MTQALLEIQQLNIHFGRKQVVHNLNLSVHKGERLALVGESGSGKTITALSILQLVPQAKVQGVIQFNGDDLLTKSAEELGQIRGGEIAMIFQEPMSALNPLFTIGNQIIETLVLHENLTATQARERAIALLARTGIREPERRIDSYPHQLSGGQLQRAVIAMALACKPKLLIADEPTTALDMTIRARIVQLLLDLQREESEKPDGEGMAILLITHDLNLVRKFAQRVAVMEKGQLVELAETKDLFNAPKHPYTLKLINSIPQREIMPLADNAKTILAVDKLRVEYLKTLKGWSSLWRKQHFIALASANIDLRSGETIGIVGESGSGKSTLAQAILGLVSCHSGELRFNGEHLPLNKRYPKQLRAKLQVVFQDPFGSLSPRRTVSQIIGEGLALHFPELSAAQRQQRIRDISLEVGLPESALSRYPHQFSGGQRQRIAIARALVLKPDVVILDEPTSALDVSIQNQVLQLLVRLQQKYALSYILISHDLAVVQALAHRIYVLKDGEIVEQGDTERVIQQPQHSYTQRLVSATL